MTLIQSFSLVSMKRKHTDMEKLLCKRKVCELDEVVLDWAVAKCKFSDKLMSESDRLQWAKINTPSTNWAQGGPIIEREGITIGDAGGSWEAGKPWADDFFSEFVHCGPTPLIAAMRCYVASKLGDVVEIPQELLNV